ncbi:MAG TPA: CvpA family protein [bacterium]|nr:CvpA family protein [bacterium]
MKWIYLDYFSLIIILINFLLGFWRGFINELFKIIAALFAAIAVYFSNNELALLFTIKFGFSFFIWKIIVGIIVYSIVYAAVIIIGKIISKAISVIQLSFFNRCIGALFGILKALIILFIIFYLLNLVRSFDEKAKNTISQKIYLTIKNKYEIPNISDAVLLVEKIEKLKNDLLTNPEAAKSKINNSEKLTKLLNNENLAESLKNKNLNELFVDPNFIEVFKDKELRKKLLE